MLPNTIFVYGITVRVSRNGSSCFWRRGIHYPKYLNIAVGPTRSTCEGDSSLHAGIIEGCRRSHGTGWHWKDGAIRTHDETRPIMNKDPSRANEVVMLMSNLEIVSRLGLVEKGVSS